MKLPAYMKNNLNMMKGRYIILFGVLAVTAVFGIIAAVGITVDSRNCAYASHRYGRPTHYDVLAGCYIQTTTGQWVGLDKYLQVNR